MARAQLQGRYAARVIEFPDVEGCQPLQPAAKVRERDAALSLPGLIVPSIQVNIRAGHLPDAEDNDIAYLKTPIDEF